MNVKELIVGDKVGIKRGYRGETSIATVTRVLKNGVEVAREDGKTLRFSEKGNLVGDSSSPWEGKTHLISEAQAIPAVVRESIQRQCRNAWAAILQMADAHRHRDTPIPASIRDSLMGLVQSIPVTEEAPQ